jgi:hypothetical protein
LAPYGFRRLGEGVHGAACQRDDDEQDRSNHASMHPCTCISITMVESARRTGLVPNGACFTGPKAVAGIPTAETASHAGNQNALRALRYSTDRITF